MAVGLTIKPEPVVDMACHTGEAPLWHPDEKRLYWIDIPLGRIYRYNPAAKSAEMCYEGDPIGGFTIQGDGALLMFQKGGTVRIWREGSVTTVIESAPEVADAMWNDCIADPMGRVFVGVKESKAAAGRVFRLDPDRGLYKVLDGFKQPNGMGFTPDKQHMFQTDTLNHERYIFDFDENTGAISNQRIYVHVPEELGRPDGMAVDCEGYVWSAHWDGGCVIRYSPNGVEDLRVELPVKKVSSMAFGGDDLMDAYITTAGGENKAEEGELAGALFYFRAGVRGLPGFRSRIAV